MIGGQNSVNKHIEKSDKVLRYAGLFIPVLMIIYGFMIKFGVIKNPNYVSGTSLYIISAAWLIVGFLQLPFKRQFISPFLKTILYHILTMAYFLFVSGFNTPFVAVWVLLLIDTTSYFGLSSIWASLFMFAVAAAIEVIVMMNGTNQMQIAQLVSVISVTVLGFVIVAVINSNQVSQEELIQSKNAEQLRREQLLTIVNSLTDGVLGVNISGRIEIYNSAALNLLDTNENLLEQNVDSLIKLSNKNGEIFRFHDELKKIRRNITRNDFSLTIDEEIMHIELSILPIHDVYAQQKNDKESSFVLLFRDITKEKTLEEEKDEFISVVSHELRTPVAIAEGAISNLQLMAEREAPKMKLIQSAQSAHSEILFLANMVNDLSTLSRTERGVGDQAEEINVRELGQNIYKKYLGEAEKVGLTLDLDLGTNLGSIRTSRLYLEELLQNFMTNSLKYTKEGGAIISIHNFDEHICFAVKDTGIGMAKKDQQRIFEKFYRSEDYRTRETGGTGLGLYVGTRLARKMGTKINLESRLNYGSTFSFNLPKIKENPKIS